MSETIVNVRYMVNDVDAAVDWYTKHLGFSLLSNQAPAFADVRRGSLRLLLSGPTSSAGRPMPMRGRRAAAWCSASIERFTPGAMTPPRYAPSASTTSKVVAVPKSTTVSGPP